MDFSSIAYIVGSIIVILILISCCCKKRKSRGQIISVTSVVPPAPAPYPQQQYATQNLPTHYPVATSYPTQSANTSMPYPTGSPYPTSAPYPTSSPYAASGAPYPTTGAPYPTGGAPYPTGAHFQPTAPDACAFYGTAPPGWHNQALPPSYDQAVNNEFKQPPFNPSAPH